MIRLVAVLSLVTSPALAQPQWEPGTYLVSVRWWNSDSNVTRNQPDPEHDGLCWQITGIVLDRGVNNGYVLRLLNGVYDPWWTDADEFFEPGFETTFFSSELYLDAHPGADNFTWLHDTFQPVAGCP